VWSYRRSFLKAAAPTTIEGIEKYLEAVCVALVSRVLVITGGPGDETSMVDVPLALNWTPWLRSLTHVPLACTKGRVDREL
jgi:hypothetical protein